jgi:NADH-quinone oxidoreductase subunit L
MNGSLHLWLIPLLPFAGFLINGLLGAAAKALVTAVALLAPLGAFGVVLNAAFRIYPSVCDCALRIRRVGAYISLPYIETFGTWLNIGTLHVDFSASSSISYRSSCCCHHRRRLPDPHLLRRLHAHDEGYARYFSYLNLFLFFMTTLVLAGNALVMFVGWEGVGLASYLLIGFWFTKPSAAAAGKKAFIVNRIGDVGFLIGMFLLLANFRHADLQLRSPQSSPRPRLDGWRAHCDCALPAARRNRASRAAAALYLAARRDGRPTPVSALIHAATMVTAGVYMIARTHVLFDHSPFALSTVAIVGAATALFAATIGLVQNDIKRVLAYSTISQLGYMFLGCGVAAYSAAVFHLMTHAFFKALLFLAAGSVIHGMGGEQDMRKMGGLRKKMPVTFWTMTAGVCHRRHLPSPASSQRTRFSTRLSSRRLGKALWFVGLVTALLTAFYMFRLWYLTFWANRAARAHPHESPWSMLGPLVILALPLDLRRLGSAWTLRQLPRPCVGPTIDPQRRGGKSLDLHSERQSPLPSPCSAGTSRTLLQAEAAQAALKLAAALPPATSCSPTSITSTSSTARRGQAAAGFSTTAGLGGRQGYSRRRRMAAGRHCHVLRSAAAALAVGQHPLLCGVAGGGRGGGAAVCSGAVDDGVLAIHSREFIST